MVLTSVGRTALMLVISNRSPCANAEIFFGCCASTMTANASSITAHKIDGTAAFFIAHLVWALFITPIAIKKSVIYGGRATDLVEQEGQNHAEIELNDASAQFGFKPRGGIPVVFNSD